jgi:hypothetical protein
VVVRPYSWHLASKAATDFRMAAETNFEIQKAITLYCHLKSKKRSLLLIS